MNEPTKTSLSNTTKIVLGAMSDKSQFQEQNDTY